MKPSLVSRGLDPWLLGGAALAFAALSLFIPASALGPGALWAVNLALSAPHFAASYLVFYGEGGPWREAKAVSVALPVALAAGLGAAIAVAPPEPMRFAAQLTVFLLHWHYLKQAYGVSLWMGAPIAGRPRESDKRAALLACLLIGAAGWLGAQAIPQRVKAFGLYLDPVAIPRIALAASRYVGVVSLVALAAWLLVARKREGNGALGLGGLVPIAALWTWMDPLFDGTILKLVLPVFHGAQYLPFPARIVLARDGRQAMARLAALGVGGIGLGYALFHAVPLALSPFVASDKAERLFSFTVIFVNLHHYFIDAVTWRFRNPATMARLFPRPAAEAGAQTPGSKLTGT